MLSLIMLHALNQQQAQRAATDQLLPLVVEAEDKQSGDRLVTHLRRMPNLGEGGCAGWTLVRHFFVDAVGLCERGDPPLTCVQFLTEVRVGYGYAILATGCFLVCIGEFTRTAARKARACRKPQRQEEVR